MKKFLRPACLLALFCLNLIQAVPARAGGVFAGLDLNMPMGLGLNLGYQINDWFKIRLQGNYLPMQSLVDMALNSASSSTDEDDVSLSTNVDWYNAGLLADVHPFAGSFRLTAGLYYLKYGINFGMTPKAGHEIEIGDHKYQANQVGRADLEIKWNHFAPYVGLGYGVEYGRHNAVNFAFSLGALYSKPKADFWVTTDPAVPAWVKNQIEADTSKELKDLNDTLDSFKIMPVISVGFTYRF
ncbi:MAG: hypothetical protein LBD82_08410 [Deltaproteobacteria bacterium]|jgi:hypothetical protein|nr:hypothetical protein [Deltaproteobacteria bacterium]